MTHPPFPRAFVVQRDEDVSGISGEGVVAEGVQFSDGWVATHWLDQPPMHEPKTDVWHNKGAQPFERVHGHGGRTRILWADEVAAARCELVDTVIGAFDVPASILGAEGERAYLHRQIERALRDAALQVHTEYKPLMGLGSVPRATEIKGHLPELADAVMPVVEQLLKQRDRWRDAVGRAFALAYRWQGAHGSANFLVRTAGVELREVLDDSATCDAYLEPTSGGIVAGGPCIKRGLHDEHETADGTEFSPIGAAHPPTEPVIPWTGPEPVWADELRGRLAKEGAAAAAECSAQYLNGVETRLCIRAAQHRGDHIDEHGFHWSDTVAMYRVVDGEAQDGRAASSCSNPGEGGCPEGSEPSLAIDFSELTAALRVLGIDMSDGPADVHGWLMAACRELEKTVAAIEGVRSVVADARKWALPGSQLASFVFRIQEALGTDEAVRFCPYCTGAPMFPSSDLPGHIRQEHTRVQAVLASGGSLDEQLAEPETRCRLPHEMEA
ncbi:hypothetical protein [Streptomyces sp. 3214.6]|uniref:hypothetical protein n=1 Tax=Streptomyces sp. 3214.6 TaxID=1882757 RepID=UPI00090BD00F|nr:hypothetical protein [Streptomyces sp. 3214.6]SHI66165.1 hypothetical protein SAMN05444521_8168 [Streptomyces sp. 3214.6]